MRPSRGGVKNVAGGRTRLAWDEVPARRPVGILRRYRPPAEGAEKALRELQSALGLGEG